MSQMDEKVVPLEEPAEPVTWRTPGRKLTKEDLSATSVLIMGCTCQECCKDEPGTGPNGELTIVEITM